MMALLKSQHYASVVFNLCLLKGSAVSVIFDRSCADDLDLRRRCKYCFASLLPLLLLLEICRNWQVVPLVELFSSKRCQLHTLFSLHCLQKDTAQIRVRGAVFCHSGRAVSWLLVGGWGAWFLLVGRMGAWWLLAGGWGAWLVLAWGAGCPGHSLAFHKSHAPESQTLFSLPQLYFTGT